MEICEHTFARLGFEVTEKTPKKIEAVAAIHCTKCGMFRTKVLTFIRELEDNQKERKRG